MKYLAFMLAGIAGAALSSAALAHHSHAMYDATSEMQIEGTVKEVRWANPHVWLYFVTTGENGQPRTWALEGASINQLARKGWTLDSFKPGDKVKIACYPLRGGGPGCLGGYILQLNGKDLPQTHERHAGREFD
jgi:hypothetical protein